jgi:hypothetical protein
VSIHYGERVNSSELYTVACVVRRDYDEAWRFDNIAVPHHDDGGARIIKPVQTPNSTWSVGNYIMVGLACLCLTLFGVIAMGFLLLSLLYKAVRNNTSSDVIKYM